METNRKALTEKDQALTEKNNLIADILRKLDKKKIKHCI